MERLMISKVNDHVYLLNDHNESTGYLVIGSKKALLIDTMNGHVDVEKEIRALTDLPYEVVNTHGHRDHVAGNIFVKEAYIHPEDCLLAEQNLRRSNDNEDELPVLGKFERWKTVLPGDNFDLGDRILEVHGVPGHTKGSICLLDRMDRILFSGDGVMPSIWIHFGESQSIQVFWQALNNLDDIREDYDMILAGHSIQPMPAFLFDRLKAGVKEIIDGKTADDLPCEFFGVPGKMHRYDETNPRFMIVY